MPPSQLKRLKASLREQGIVGPQKSKKQKKKNREGDNAEERNKKSAALASIRESFNPFEFKTLARPKKFDVVTNRPENKVVLGRPGVSKSQGEEARRKTLLPEMHRRNKVGGILDRRIGENDPTMSLDDKMMARFTREQQNRKGASVFDLEEAEDEIELTHGGQALKFDLEDEKEDYDAASVEGLSDDEDGGILRRKRRRDSDAGAEADDAEAAEDRSERKKSKAEVMKEVMAKSKLHKYERQQAKEEDEELREELDKDLPDILAALRGHITKPPPPPPMPTSDSKDGQTNNFPMNADRAALLAGNKTREELDKEYDARVRQMMFDRKAQPTERTKTEEEKAKEEADRLKKLEESRMRRMRGEEDESEPEDKNKQQDSEDLDEAEDEESDRDDAKEFGLPSTAAGTRPQGIEDEDDFLMDDDLIASDSEADISEASSDEESEDDTMGMDEDDEFLKDVLPDSSKPKKDGKVTDDAVPSSSKLAYTYPCPESHEELLDVFQDVSPSDIPVVVQRIRALYHQGLHPDNKTKLANFACALVDHISHMASAKPAAPLTLVETIIRHVQSMSRTFPVQIATQFREHLKQLQASNDPTPGDLAVLTAIGTIYPTSDHFHQVVTPAITLMARWLSLTTPQSTKDIATGAYIGALCLKYQTLSKRYIPELIRYTNLSLQSQFATPPLIEALLKNLFTMTDLWSTKSAFIEIFSPTLPILKSTHQTASHQRLLILLNNATLHRRPLELHHHRPLPIKTHIPKFEESFDPNKHYDPDKDRAEAARLRKEFKRERKGALRELRKDAHFIAREQLKEKKERDRRYEEKYRKLVAEIQGEEGREKNAYEREKKARKRRG